MDNKLRFSTKKGVGGDMITATFSTVGPLLLSDIKQKTNHYLIRKVKRINLVSIRNKN